MKKLLVFSMLLVSFVSYGQKLVPVIRTDAFGKEYIVYKEVVEEKQNKKSNYNNQPQTDYTFSIGTLGGIGNSFNGDFGSGLAYSYGAYIEIGRVGFEGIFGAGLTNNDPSSYINGNSSKYVAGYSMSGVGAYYKFPTQSNMGEYYFGLGYQGLDEIATNNPLWVKAPYGIVGLKGYYFNNCELKIEGNIGVISTINFGFGVRL